MEDNNLLRRESEERFSNVVWTISEKYSIDPDFTLVKFTGDRKIDLYNNTLLKYKSSMYMMPYSGETKVYPVETELEKKGLTREGKIDILNQRIISKIEQFHGANLMIHTRNPKYKNSTFTKLVNKIVSNELSIDNTVDPSAEDLVQIYKHHLKG